MTTDFPGAPGGEGGGGGEGGSGMVDAVVSAIRRRVTSTAEKSALANVPLGASDGTPVGIPSLISKRKREQRDTVLTGTTGPGEGGNTKRAVLGGY